MQEQIEAAARRDPEASPQDGLDLGREDELAFRAEFRRLAPAPARSGPASAEPRFGNGGEGPAAAYLDALLEWASARRASDLYLEPEPEGMTVRCRLDGSLVRWEAPRPGLAQAVVSRIKALAQLDIAERRHPQDGRLEWSGKDGRVEIRVATLPTVLGESLAMRLLNQASGPESLDRIGMPEPVLRSVRRAIRRPEGLFLIAGPTGAGKTTTLYAALREIAAPEVKIITVEDPVEFELDGVIQVPLAAAAGLTFATALRAFVRQDPDVIMVGEIRDRETARIAVQAALTGHLVAGSLHARDSVGAVARMLELGVEAHLLATVLDCVLAQRLLRKLCPHCRTPVSGTATPGSGPDAGPRGLPGCRAAGCPACQDTGYAGRLALFEWLEVSDRVRDLVATGAPAGEIRRAARDAGSGSLREEGLRAVAAGAAVLEEVLAAT